MMRSISLWLIWYDMIYDMVQTQNWLVCWWVCLLSQSISMNDQTVWHMIELRAVWDLAERWNNDELCWLQRAKTAAWRRAAESLRPRKQPRRKRQRRLHRKVKQRSPSVAVVILLCWSCVDWWRLCWHAPVKTLQMFSFSCVMNMEVSELPYPVSQKYPLGFLL